MTTPEPSCQAAFERAGFKLEKTGGGCSAWVMRLRNGRETWVSCDLNAPNALTDPCHIATYARGENGSVSELDMTDSFQVKFFLEWLEIEASKTGKNPRQIMEEIR